MKVVVWVSDGKRREQQLAENLCRGVINSGDKARWRIKPAGGAPIEDCDIACFVGVKNRENFKRYKEAGIHYGYFDKGYNRRLIEETVKGGEWLEYWRVSVDGHQPLPFIATAKKDNERAEKAGFRLEPWREKGEAILLDGSSEKHYAFAEYGHPTEWARATCVYLRTLTDRPIIYRPKPSWTGAVEIEGTEWSGGKDYRPAFARSHVLITSGSNLCFDAALAGVPSIVLGEGVARPISSTTLDDVETPRMATDQERKQWASNVAWCQFKLEEFSSGLAWKTMREMLECSKNQ